MRWNPMYFLPDGMWWSSLPSCENFLSPLFIFCLFYFFFLREFFKFFFFFFLSNLWCSEEVFGQTVHSTFSYFGLVCYLHQVATPTVITLWLTAHTVSSSHGCHKLQSFTIRWKQCVIIIFNSLANLIVYLLFVYLSIYLFGSVGLTPKRPSNKSCFHSQLNWTELNRLKHNPGLFPMLNTVWFYTKILEAMIDNKI